MGQDDKSWLSFSRPQEMLRSSTSSQHQQPHQILQSSYANSGEQYCFDNLYAPNYADWSNSKGQVMFTGGGNHQGEVKEAVTESFFTSFETSPAPKLEDFLGGDPETTQEDSSLTHNFDHSDLTAFQAFSTNSGSEEVDDSAQLEYVGQSIESGKELVAAYSQECPYGGVLTLGVNHGSSSNTTNRNPMNAIVPVDSGGSKKIIADTFGQRTSIYRGVTRHRWTGRYEAHLWDNSCRREGQARKGRQVYLGGYDKEDNAARAYDLAALKYWGPTATINFPVTTYTKELEEMKNVAKQEFIASLRRKSSGFSRGASIYRGVTRHHQQGRWQARIGRVAGNKDLYLGTFATEEEAAEAYDIAAIKFRGLNAVTNFEMNRYDVEAITKCSLPIAGATKRLKLSLEAEEKPSLSSNPYQQSNSNNSESSIDFAAAQPVSAIPFGVPFDSTTPFYHHSLFHHLCSSNAGTSDTSGTVTSAETPVPPAAGFFVWPRQSY